MLGKLKLVPKNQWISILSNAVLLLTIATMTVYIAVNSLCTYFVVQSQAFCRDLDMLLRSCNCYQQSFMDERKSQGVGPDFATEDELFTNRRATSIHSLHGFFLYHPPLCDRRTPYSGRSNTDDLHTERYYNHSPSIPPFPRPLSKFCTDLAVVEGWVSLERSAGAQMVKGSSPVDTPQN
jgi:hypothetical protein